MLEPWRPLGLFTYVADKIMKDLGLIVDIGMEIDDRLEAIINKQKEMQKAECSRIIAENNNNH